MSTYVIGLTGGIACGKSNLSAALQKAGAPVIDADRISRALTADGGEALDAIRQRWGERVFDGESLNRRALSDIIFRDEGERQALNAIIHPMVFARMREEIDACQGPVVLDVPLLFEVGMDQWCDEIWCAYVPQEEQIRRLKKREGISRAEALRRIRSQMPAREKKKRAHWVIRTDGSKEESARIVLSLWHDVPQHQLQRKGETDR